MVRWMSPQVPVPVWHCLVWPWQSISVTRRGRMCYSSLTTSSGTHVQLYYCTACGSRWALIRITTLPSLNHCCDEPLVRLESLTIAKNFMLGWRELPWLSEQYCAHINLYTCVAFPKYMYTYYLLCVVKWNFVFHTDSPRLVLRCLPCLVVSPLPWVTSQPWPLIWVLCRRESPQHRRDPSHPCRLVALNFIYSS